MTSVKCFINWCREAGRGHLAAAFGWGTLVLYGILAVTRLSFDTENTFFGIGGTALELRWICMGLGLLIAFLEFFYLFRQRQQDFYYSLPVSRSTVFWSRYVHGLFHVLAPIVLVMAVCGIYQTSIDPQFGMYAGSYTLKSILVYAATFMIFYHMGILSIVVCGNMISAAAVCAAGLLWFSILTGNICVTLSKIYFTTYYKNPLLERLYIILSPERLTAELTGMEVLEKPFVLGFTPELYSVTAAVVWIAVLFALSVSAQRMRKTESTGRAFTLIAAERTAQIAASFLAGLWMFSFLSDLLGRTAEGIMNLAVCSAGGVLTAFVVHCLLEYAVKGEQIRILRRKWQLAVSAAAVLAAGLAFPAGASAYDAWIPEETDSIGVSVDGIGMDYWDYRDAAEGGEAYITETQLDKYVLKGEGQNAALRWLHEIIRDSAGTDGETYTRAKICYHMPDGSVRYRSYSLNKEQVEQFASVYETDEYRRIAYPAVEFENVEEDRFTWEDGVTGTALQVTGEQKETLLDAYREDVSELKMEQIGRELPCGYVRIRSSENGSATDMYVYPFFQRTCARLEEYGADTEKTLADYEVDSIQMMENYPASDTGSLSSGGTYVSYYEKKDEVDALKQTLIPDGLDIQPLLYPLDHSSDIEASVFDEETSSVIHVSCARSENR